MPRSALVLAAALATVLSLTVPALAGETTIHTLRGNAVYPEGVAVEPGTERFYVSSNQDGTIYRGSLSRRATSVFLPPGGDGRRNANGLFWDDGRLFVAGLASGYVFVYDTRTRALVRRFDTRGSSPPLINDVTVGPSGDAWATDSVRSLLFRMPARSTRGGRPRTAKIKPWLNFDGTIIPTGSQFNVNGLVVTDDGRYVIVVHTTSSRLFRIDTRTKRIVEVELDEPALVGDGLILRGRTLYVIGVAGVLKYRLSRTFASGTRLSVTSDPTFRFPTTGAILGNRLLVVNAQFDRRERGEPPELPFTVSDLPVP